MRDIQWCNLLSVHYASHGSPPGVQFPESSQVTHLSTRCFPLLQICRSISVVTQTGLYYLYRAISILCICLSTVWPLLFTKYQDEGSCFSSVGKACSTYSAYSSHLCQGFVSRLYNTICQCHCQLVSKFPVTYLYNHKRPNMFSYFFCTVYIKMISCFEGTLCSFLTFI